MVGLATKLQRQPTSDLRCNQSISRDFLTKHKIKEKQMKKKALRKEMKQTELEA
jgi:hypothetical protein